MNKESSEKGLLERGLCRIDDLDKDQWMWIGFLAGFLFGVMITLGALI